MRAPGSTRQHYHPTLYERAQTRLADATTALRIAEATERGVQAATWGTIYVTAFAGLLSIKLPGRAPTLDDVKAAVLEEVGLVYRTVAWPLFAAAAGANEASRMVGEWLDNLTLGAAGKIHHRMEKERQSAVAKDSWGLTLAEAAMGAALTVVALQALVGSIRVRPG